MKINKIYITLLLVVLLFPSMAWAGECLSFKENIKNAEENYKNCLKAAETGDAEASYKLSGLYLKGIGINKNISEAMRLLKLSAGQGYLKSQIDLGAFYIRSGNYKEGIKLYRLAAEQGSIDAQYMLGAIYYSGHIVERNYKESMKWYKLAAEKGYIAAQLQIGVLYGNGNGKEAAKWYALAAEQGNAEAQRRLAILYHFGMGVKKDYIKAREWYMLAAQQGDAYAQNNLGMMYVYGQGVVRDYKKAYAWLSTAESNIIKSNKEDIIEKIDKLKKHLSPEEIIEAEKLTEEYIKKTSK